MAVVPAHIDLVIRAGCMGCQDKGCCFRGSQQRPEKAGRERGLYPCNVDKK